MSDASLLFDTSSRSLCRLAQRPSGRCAKVIPNAARTARHLGLPDACPAGRPSHKPARHCCAPHKQRSVTAPPCADMAERSCCRRCTGLRQCAERPLLHRCGGVPTFISQHCPPADVRVRPDRQPERSVPHWQVAARRRRTAVCKECGSSRAPRLAAEGVWMQGYHISFIGAATGYTRGTSSSGRCLSLLYSIRGDWSGTYWTHAAQLCCSVCSL